MSGHTRVSGSAFRASRSGWRRRQSVGGLCLARCWVSYITTTTGKQRSALGKEEVSPKHTITEADIEHLRAASVLRSANSH